jgi:hypothetical protein
MTSTATRPGATSKRVFARHYLEMVVVMLLGMGVFAGLAALAFSLAGSSLGDQSAGLRVSLMGLYMTIPMVAWMAWHRHAAARTVEMAGAMIVPTALTATLAWAAVLELEAALGIQHGIMFPAMLGVMLWRYEVYARL